jgi:hypothetical protein
MYRKYCCTTAAKARNWSHATKQRFVLHRSAARPGRGRIGRAAIEQSTVIDTDGARPRHAPNKPPTPGPRSAIRRKQENRKKKEAAMALHTHSDVDIHPQSAAAPSPVVASTAYEGAAGLGAVVLAIVALTGVAPGALLAIGTIAAGTGLLLRGLSLGVRLKKSLEPVVGRGQELTVEGGVGVEVVAGISGIVLGVLALLSVAPTVLVPAAVTAFGAALFIGAGVASAVINRLTMQEPRATHVIAEVSEGATLLIGLGVATLGILALVGLAEQTLSLAAMIAVGGGLILEASPVLSRLLGL